MAVAAAVESNRGQEPRLQADPAGRTGANWMAGVTGRSPASRQREAAAVVQSLNRGQQIANVDRPERLASAAGAVGRRLW